MRLILLSGPPKTCDEKERILLDSYFFASVDACLQEAPVDGLCYTFGTVTKKFGVMPDWDTHRVENMEAALKNKTLFNGDITKWNTSSVTSIRDMFYSASSFNQDISGWDVSQVNEHEEYFTERLHSIKISQAGMIFFFF